MPYEVRFGQTSPSGGQLGEIESPITGTPHILKRCTARCSSTTGHTGNTRPCSGDAPQQVTQGDHGLWVDGVDFRDEALYPDLPGAVAAEAWQDTNLACPTFHSGEDELRQSGGWKRREGWQR